jgi:hypothetical protein
MAKFINFKVTNAFALGPGAPAPERDGDNLVNADNILTVKAEAGGPNPQPVYQVILELVGGKKVYVTASTDAAAVTPVNPSSGTGYLALMKKAVIRAITANPGGVKAGVILPQDTLDSQAGYDPALKVYWKDFEIS